MLGCLVLAAAVGGLAFAAAVAGCGSITQSGESGVPAVVASTSSPTTGHVFTSTAMLLGQEYRWAPPERMPPTAKAGLESDLANEEVSLLVPATPAPTEDAASLEAWAQTYLFAPPQIGNARLIVGTEELSGARTGVELGVTTDLSRRSSFGDKITIRGQEGLWWHESENGRGFPATLLSWEEHGLLLGVTINEDKFDANAVRAWLEDWVWLPPAGEGSEGPRTSSPYPTGVPPEAPTTPLHYDENGPTTTTRPEFSEDPSYSEPFLGPVSRATWQKLRQVVIEVDTYLRQLQLDALAGSTRPTDDLAKEGELVRAEVPKLAAGDSVEVERHELEECSGRAFAAMDQFAAQVNWSDGSSVLPLGIAQTEDGSLVLVVAFALSWASQETPSALPNPVDSVTIVGFERHTYRVVMVEGPIAITDSTPNITTTTVY